MVASPIRWSHSQLDKFKTCPWSWKRIYQDKDVVRTESEATRWGTAVHTACEEFILKGTPLPANVTFAYGSQLQHILPFMASKPEVLVEPHMGIDEEGNAVNPDSPLCWSHGYIDITAVDGATAWIGDYKTGKSTFPSDQLKLYAVYIFAHRPLVQQINTGYYRLQHKRVDSAVYTRDMVPHLLQPYRVIYANLLSAIASNNFPKIRNPLCGHCDVRDCPYNTVDQRLRKEREQ